MVKNPASLIKHMVVTISATGSVFLKYWGSVLNTLIEACKRRRAYKHLLDQEVTEIRQKIKKEDSSIVGREKVSEVNRPCYVFIGTKGSGKRSVLQHLGTMCRSSKKMQERHHLNRKDARFGCNVWHSDKANFLEMPNCSNGTKNGVEHCRNILKRLSRHRKKIVIKGAVLIVDLSRFLMGSEEDKRIYFRMRLNELQEIYEGLGHIVPIHILFSRCDHVEGFYEYASLLSTLEKNAVVGFELKQNRSLEQIKHDLETASNALYETLCTTCVAKLHMLDTQEGRMRLFDFPSQIHVVMKAINEILANVLLSTISDERLFLQGYYLVSSTQDGKDGVIAKNEGVSNTRVFIRKQMNDCGVPRKNTSFSLKNIFDEIFTNQTTHRHKNAKMKKRETRFAISTCIFFLILIVSVIRVIGSDFSDKRRLLIQMEMQTKTISDTLKIQKNNTDKLGVLKESIVLYNKLLSSNGKRSISNLWGSSTDKRILALSGKMIATLIDKSLHLSVQRVLETRLLAMSKAWSKGGANKEFTLRGKLYGLLNVYVMYLYPSRLSLSFALKAIKQINWLDVNRNVDDFHGLYSSAAFWTYALLNPQPNHTLNRTLIDQVREQLRSNNYIENEYAFIRTEAIRLFSDVSVDSLLPQEDKGIFNGHLRFPGLYTMNVWHSYVKPQIEKMATEIRARDWMMHETLGRFFEKPHKNKSNQAKINYIKQSLYAKYMSEYALSWLNFISHIQLRPFESLQDAYVQLQQLSEDQGPILHLLAVSKDALNIKEEKAYTYSSAKTKAVFDKVDAFSALNKNIASYLNVIKRMKKDLEKYFERSNSPEHLIRYVKAMLGTERSTQPLYLSLMDINKVMYQSGAIDEKYSEGSAFISPVKEIFRLVLREANHVLQQRWREEVFDFYQIRLANKFPLARSNTEILPADMLEFFHPHDGQLWRFYHQQLKEFISFKRTHHTEKKWLSLGLGFNSSVIEFFKQAEGVSKGLFQKHRFGFPYAIQVLPSPGLKDILFSDNAHTLHYQNTPEEWRSLYWSDTSEDPVAILQLKPLDAPAISIVNRSTWGLFYLLSKAKLHQVSNTRFLATWSFQQKHSTYTVRFLFKEPTPNGVLSQLLFHAFSVPETLFLN